MTDRGNADFTHVVDIRSLPAKGANFTLEAPESAYPAIAARLGIPAVRRLAGRISLKPTAAGVSLEGELDAQFSRVCVRSLEPMEETLSESFAIAFARDAANDGDVEDLDYEAPEPLEGETLDLADILIQQAALAMDPYPARDDAEIGGSTSDPADVSPFAVLKGAIAPERDGD